MSAVGGESEALLDVEQLAQYLSCSVSWLRKLTGKRAIPLLRLGGQRGVRFRKSDIDAWLKTRSEGVQ